jgi:hypothetical protein
VTGEFAVLHRGARRWRLVEGKCDSEKADQVLVHYVGCDNDDEDEWIQESSHRFRWYAPLAHAVKCDVWSLELVHMNRILLVPRAPDAPRVRCFLKGGRASQGR